MQVPRILVIFKQICRKIIKISKQDIEDILSRQKGNKIQWRSQDFGSGVNIFGIGLVGVPTKEPFYTEECWEIWKRSS